MRARKLADLAAALAALRLAARLARLAAALRSTRLRRILRRSLAPALALALAVAPLAAQEPGPEQQVSPDSQRAIEPSVAMDDQGEFVVAWHQQFGAVFVRRYGADGAPPGAAQPISGNMTVNSSRPAIAMDDEGAFVVAWEGQQTFDFNGEIYLRRFDAGGQPLEGPVRVNSSTTNSQQNPAVAMNAEGEFVVAWTDRLFGTGSYTDTIEFRRFDAAGQPLDLSDRAVASFSVSTFADAPSPDVALDADGDFVVVWEQSENILGARYLPTSDQPDSTFGSSASGSQLFSHPSVAIDADGSFVVAWNDTVFDNVLAQRFTPGGQQDGARFTVSESFLTYSSPSEAPRATYLPDGPVFAWTGEGQGDSADDNEVVFRRFGPAGPIDTTEQQVAQLFPFGAEYADIDASPFGSFVVVWNALVQICTAACIDSPTVFARLYTPRNSYSLSTSTAGTHEGSGAPVVFTVSRGSTAGASRVGYSFGGTATFGDTPPFGDYRLRSAPAGVITATGTISFPRGVREQRIELEIVDDTRGEPAKSIVLSLRSLTPGDTLVFPVAVVTLGDNDLSEVRITQSGGSTVIGQDGQPDSLSVALRTVPSSPVEVTLTPTDRRINLGLGFNTPLRLVFRPDESAKTPQHVQVFTASGEGEAALAANAGIALSASSADPAYGEGARFTVDGRDLGAIPVEVVTRPGENPNPLLPSVFLPLVQR